jgi:glutamyl-Q tRNA(Asp) synthetase
MNARQPTVTRFAPSPTGFLHVGHAHAALFARAEAAAAGDRFLVRIEDIDRGRCRPEFAAAILDDLAWLGLAWEEPVRRQSAHMADYAAALDALRRRGLLYPCFCTRADVRAEIAAAGHAPHAPPPGADGPRYPGTCRRLASTEAEDRIAAGRAYALRLDVEKASRAAGPLAWRDRAAGAVEARPEMFGDVVLARKDTPTSYHLAVTVDDDLQGVTLVTRGRDLFDATHVHRLLQALLGLETPEYHHHRLLCDADGRRFAKRDAAATIRSLRESGLTPAEVRAMAGFPS